MPGTVSYTWCFPWWKNYQSLRTLHLFPNISSFNSYWSLPEEQWWLSITFNSVQLHTSWKGNIDLKLQKCKKWYLMFYKFNFINGRWAWRGYYLICKPLQAADILVDNVSGWEIVQKNKYLSEKWWLFFHWLCFFFT